MNTFDSGTTAVPLEPLTSSSSSEKATEALRNAILASWTIEYYGSLFGGIANIEISAVQNMMAPIIHVKVTGKARGKVEVYFRITIVKEQVSLIEYDLPNVQRCSTDPEVRRQAGHPC